jgi:hypothetical protein
MFVVDLGFSSAKWLYNEKKGSIMSCYRKVKDEAGHSFKGDSYIIGERALLSTGSHYLRTIEELLELYPLFVGISALKAGIEFSDDSLTVGLPYDFWKSENEKRKRGSANAIDILTESLSSINFNERQYKFNKINILPQGLGGIKAYLSQNNNPTGNILAIDIGFNTVIATLYSTTEGEILTGRTYYKKGLHEMAVNLLMPDIQKHIQGKTLTPIEINYIIQAGKLQIGFDLIDITPEITASINAYIKDLFSLIFGDLKAHFGVVRFETVLLFGGGARYLENKVESSRVKIIVLSDPEYANAEGFFIRAKELSDALSSND